MQRRLAIGRLIFGTTFTLLPVSTKTWIGADAQRPATQVVVTAFGARDAAIGAGLLATAGTAAAKPWLLAGIASDAADLVATLRAGDALPALGRNATIAIAGGAVIAGLACLLQSD